MEVPDVGAFAIENGSIVHNCATRYAMMMRRIAKTKAEANPKKPTQTPQRSVFARGDEHGWLA
jgi:hypothetical protein